MQKIIMLKGLPASFKSSWAKEQVAKGGYLRVSMDDIRASVFGGWSPKKEKACLRLRDNMVRFGIAEGKNVIVDATNLNPKHKYRLKRLAEELGVKFEINDSFLERTPEECIESDLHRGEAAVGAKVIWELFYRWVAPNPLEKLQKDFDKPRAVLCDIDGCLAIKTGDRSYYDMSRVGEDSVNPFVGCIIDALREYGLEEGGKKYPYIILISGRGEEAREATEKWLAQNCIEYDSLIMRDFEDNRSDEIVKKELFQKQIEPYYAILGVIDDRPKVCRMRRSLGLMTLQAGFPEVEF